MYSVLPNFIIGFHGCDESVAEEVLSGKTRLKKSSNSYDWLGHGIYFWENNPRRALQYAESIKKYPNRCRSIIKNPSVLGAVIDPGHCLNLLDSKNLELVKLSYGILEAASRKIGFQLPKNTNIENNKDLLLRPLDCIVIENTHNIQRKRVEENDAHYEFDTVRAVFVEGNKLYQNSGFCDKNHIQMCVRNPNSIKGYFRVLDPDRNYRIP